MFRILNGREHFFQWDLNQKLIIEDTSINQVHFCNRTDTCSLVCEVFNEDGLVLVNVPNILLQTDAVIRVYAYQTDHTVIEKRFKVCPRTKPADYVYTETEVLLWEQLEAELRADVEANNAAIKADVEAIKADTEANNAAIKAEVESVITEVSNSLKEAASGRDAIALTGISPLQKTAKLNLSRVNLIDESELNVWQYTLTNLEVGKNYTLSYKTKDIELPDNLIINLWNYTIPKSESLILNGVVDNASISFTVAEGDEWIIEVDGTDLKINDYIENVQLEEGIVATAYAPYIEDMNNISFYKYGKNLCNFTRSSWQPDYSNGSLRYSMELFVPCDVVVSFKRSDTRGTYNVLKSKDNWANQTSVGYLGTEGNKDNPVKITKQDGYRYKILTTNASYGYDNVEWVQVEVGKKATDYEPFQSVEITDINNVALSHPNTVIGSDTKGVNVSAHYNKDLNKVIADLTAAIISLGGNV